MKMKWDRQKGRVSIPPSPPFIKQSHPEVLSVLRKLKAIAKRAGLNCGQCKVAIREGRYHNRHEVEVTCETRPVCEEHYLHGLRKAAATNWLRSGFDLMKIKSWLGHKSLEVTQIYFDAEMHDPEEQKKLDHAGKF
jgi:integrase